MRSGRGCDLIKVGEGGRHPCCLHSTQCQRPMAGTGGFRVGLPGKPPAGTRCARLHSVDSVPWRGVGPWTATSTPPTTSSPPCVLIRSCTITRLAFVNVRSGKKGAWISSCFLQSIPPKCWGRFGSRPVPPPLPLTDNSPTWRLCTVSRLLQRTGRLSWSASPMRRHMPSMLVPTLRPRRSSRGTLIRRTVDSGCCPILGIPARTLSTAIG